MNNKGMLAGLGLVLLVVGVTGRMEFTDDVNSQVYYCKMVDVYNASIGEHGHPDYKDVYKEQCKNAP